jgi:uncharacterized protein YlzI (FlbEa/FlbD family)
MFIELELVDGEAVWVNPEHIAYIWTTPNDDETRVCLADSENDFAVRGTQAEVAAKLNGAQPRPNLH